MSVQLQKDRVIDWVLDEQAKGTIKNVRWSTDARGVVNFTFSMDSETVKTVSPAISPTYRNSVDDEISEYQYAENA